MNRSLGAIASDALSAGALAVVLVFAGIAGLFVSVVVAILLPVCAAWAAIVACCRVLTCKCHQRTGTEDVPER